MTQDQLPSHHMPVSHSWTLWSRHAKKGRHWTCEATNKLSKIEKFAALMGEDNVMVECLILPPGEVPMMQPAHCDWQPE